MLSEQQQRIMGYFIEEAKDHLNTIEQGLLNLQGTIEDAEMVNEVFRAAHSVKGGAAMLGLTSIQHTAHRLEDYFKVLRECPQVKVDQKLETLFLRVFDSLQDLLEQLQGPFGLTEDKAAEVMAGIEPVFAELNQHLTRLVNQAGGPPPEPLEAAVAVTAPQSVPQSGLQRPVREESVLRLIFQSDVPVRLREMLQLFKQPDTTDTRKQLQDLCRRLAQPGEQLDLPAWCELLRSAQRAIANPHNSYRALAPVVIKDVKQAQELVLAGRSTDIAPSEGLLALLPPPGSLAEEQLVDLDLANLLAAMDASNLDTPDRGSVIGESAQAEPDLLLADLAEADAATPSALSDEDWLSNPFAPDPELPTTELPEQSGTALSVDPIWAADEAAAEAIAPDAFNFMDLEMTPSTPDPEHQAGPEVGPTELNTLADLFEGELPDLGLTWQEEEILAADADRRSSPPPASPAASDSSEELSLDELEEEDLSGLLNSPEPPETVAEPAEEPDGFDLDGFADLELEFDELQEPDLWDDASLTAFPAEAGNVELEQLNFPEVNSANHAADFDLEQLLGGLEGDAQTQADPNSSGFSGTELDDLSNLFGAAPQDMDALFEELEQSTQPPHPGLPELPIAEENADPDALMAELFQEASASESSTFDDLSESLSLDVELRPEIDLWDSIETDPAMDPHPFWNQTSDQEAAPLPPAAFDALNQDALNQIDEFAADRLPAEANADQAGDHAIAEPEVELPGDASLDLGTFDDIPEPIDDLDSLFAEEGEFAAVADAAIDPPADPPETGTADAIDLELELLAGEGALQEDSELAQSPASFETMFAAEEGWPELQDEDAEDFLDPLAEAIAAPPEAEETADFTLDEQTLDEQPAETLDSERFDLSLEAPAAAAIDSLELPLEENLAADFTAQSDALIDDVDWASAEIGDRAGEEPADSIAADQEALLFEPASAADREWFDSNLSEGIESEALGVDSVWEADSVNLSPPDQDFPDQDFTDLEAMLEEPAVDLAPDPDPAELAPDPERLIDPEPDLIAESAAPLPIEAESATEQNAVVDPLLELDDFADLEALLGEESLEMEAAPAPLVRLEADDGFGDLEALLQDADQTLGGGAAPRGNRIPSITANRRPNRRTVLSDQTMRVSVKHLDNLNNLVGEMVVNRNSLEQAQERLRQFLDNLLYQVQQLNDVGQRMRDLYERSLLESSLLSSRRSSHLLSQGNNFTTAQSSHATGMNFDALEMDRFTGFHTLSQEMIELIVRVRESASDIDFVVEESDQVTRNFRQITTQLQEGLNRSRMVPFAQTADRLPRGVRDNSLKYGKQAELMIEGRETLIDKMIVEQLYDPMTHLVNNAIAHGIETPEERIAAGKPPTGQITIRAFHQGNQTVISVSDDGAGIDPELVKTKAIAKGLITPAEARELSRLDCYDLLFHHGFSTVDQVDDLRGRGVGLDVVQSNLNEIRGTITTDSIIGKGTTFTIRLPLTLSISKALCCINHRARIAFPMDGVEDMLDLPRDRVQIDAEGRSCIYWRDTLLPFQPLSDLLKYSRILGRGSVYGGNQEEDIISIVVLRSAGSYLAIQVDQVLGEQEIVIKQLEGPVPKPIGVAGATVLGDGRIMPIADVLELIDLWQGRIRRESSSSLWDKQRAGDLSEAALKTESTVLIVDDSITVRELLSMTFSKVGYRVEQARDGQEAWEKLRSGLPCDLVFCDIEMPRMDGLELLSRIQKDPHFQHLPIAMLTSRGADRHRQMAIQLGAKGYFTKPYLEEVLLDAAQRMLKGEVLVNSSQG